jgi:hypothetical protein
MGEKVDQVKPESRKKGEIIAENRPTWLVMMAAPSKSPEIRRCRRCGVRYVITMGFYRNHKGRGGRESVCKRCRNRQRARWARACYVPKTGRRYLTKADRSAENGGSADVEARGRA